MTTLYSLERKYQFDDTTIGLLYRNDKFFCYTLEDQIRPLGIKKVPGETAIPDGLYQMKNTWSPKYKKDMPILLGVPGFEGIRVHSGNNKDDTEGCILLGEDYDLDKRWIYSSRKAFDKFYKQFLLDLKLGSVHIEVSNSSEDKQINIEEIKV